MNDIIRVVIADDHSVYRDGLRLLISADDSLELTGEASNGRRLVSMVQAVQPDVVLTDIAMPEVDGIAAIRQITQLPKVPRMVALSTYDSDSLILEALDAGAIGYIIKNAQSGEIVEAIKTVAEGHPYYCRSTTIKLARRMHKSAFNPYLRQAGLSFTDTELAIIRLICEEKTSSEISRAIFKSVRRVEYLRGQILQKMHVKTAAGIVIYAIKNGLYQV